MLNDFKYALALGLLSTTLLWKPVRYPFLEFMDHPVSLVLAGVIISYSLFRGLILSGMVLLMVSVYLLSEWTTYNKTSERKVYLDTVKADIRFTPAHSIDLQFANKTAQFESPKMLQGPIPHSEPLLTYPPSSETLREMNG
jgi:hypothetical protein